MDALNQTTRFVYDDAGRKVQQQTADGAITKFEFDAAGNTVAITDANDSKFTFEHDANGNILKATDPYGNNTVYTYDGMNNRISETDPSGKTVTYTYDCFANVLTTTDADGNTTTLAYNATGKPIKITDPNGNETLYEYDTRFDKISKVTNAVGGIQTITYDTVGNGVSATAFDQTTASYVYPPILTEQEYSAMQAFKSQKNTQKNIDHSDNIFKLNAPVVCANCGGRMQRRIDNRRKTITRWRCTECKTSVNISDEDMLGGITELLNEVIADPESIQIPKSDYEESQEIKRLNAEISKELNTVGFDKEAIKQKMLTCVSEKYMSLGTEEVTAQSLKDIFKDTPPLTAYDSDLTDQAVSGIQLKENGTISLVLINGQRIGKEKSA